MSCTRKVWEGGTKRERFGLSHQHEGHRGAEEDDIGIGVLFEVFVLEISILDACLVIVLDICPRQLQRLLRTLARRLSSVEERISRCSCGVRW